MNQKKSIFTLPVNIMGRRVCFNIDSHKVNKLINFLLLGFLTTAINFITFSLCIWLNIHYLVSNVLAFVIAIIFAYYTNKRWVFAETSSEKHKFNEFIKFIACRVSTLLLESIILFLFITLLEFNQYAVKIVANVIVVCANYLLSEFIVFRKKKLFKGFG